MSAWLSRIVRSAIDSRMFVFLAAAAAFVIGAKGQLHLSPDASFYLQLAAALQAGRYSILAVGTQANFSVAGFVLLLAAVRTISPQHWQVVMLLVNVACAATTAVLLVGIVRKATTSVAAAVLALLAYVGCFDVFVWVRFLLTDHIYTVISLVAFLLALRGVLDPEAPQRGRRILLWLTTGLAVVARPVGIVLVPVVALTEWTISRRSGKGGKEASWRTVWIVIIAGGMAALLVHAWFFQDMQRWPVQWLRPKLVE